MSIADLKSRLLVSETSDEEEDSTTDRDIEQIEDEYIEKHGVPPPPCQLCWLINFNVGCLPC